MTNFACTLTACLLILLALGIPAHAQDAKDPSALRATAHKDGLDARVMWMDATANLDALKTRAGVRDIVAKCKKANINTIVLDVKPLVGEVLYNSRVAPRLRQWKGKPYPADYDLLQTMLEEAHAVGIPVYASLNVFGEGHRDVKQGPGYQKLDWQTVVYSADRKAVAENAQTFPLASTASEAPKPNALAVWTTSPKPGKAGELDAVVTDGRVTAVVEGERISAPGLVFPEGSVVLSGVGEGRDWLLRNAAMGASLKLEARPAFAPITQSNAGGWAVFVNPIHPRARAYELEMIRELFECYDIDGIALDRMRYANQFTDFSPLSRAKFERWLGKPVEQWPEDIFAQNPIPGKPIIRGKLYKDWIEWRAWNIQQFLADVEAARRVIRPRAKVASYVGSWYGSYNEEGVNWASDQFKAGYDWMSPDYHTTGYAQLLDFLMVGAYYKVATREEARQLGTGTGATVQAAVEESVRVVDDATWVYGGLYLLDYKGNPDAFERAVRAATAAGEGVMLFDLVYVREYDWWSILERLFPTPAKAPHDAIGLRESLRKTAE